jgi:uncharacterized membrane protein YhaH (DUF805 family)
MTNLFTFEGRLGRLAYFGYTILLVLIGIVAALLASVVAGAIGILGILLMFIIAVAMIWSGLSLGARRLHDMDMSGWFYVPILLIPGAIGSFGQTHHSDMLTIGGGLMSLFFTLFLTFWPGTSGSNRYG